MTQKEAQQLIAEINKWHTCNCTYECDGCGIKYKEVAKIITRFANNPPYGSKCFSGDISLSRNFNKTFNLMFETGFAPDFSKEQLIALRDNITKMLEWLNENN